jgi:multicomponent Na+:H+ antiporter subunit A
VVALMIVAGAFTAASTASTLTAVAALGVSGYGVALLYFLFGAPDLALTQFVVETLTVILFVLVIYHLPPFSSLSSRASRARDWAVAAVVGSVVASVALLAMNDELDLSVPEYYAEASLPLAHGRNIVNVILVDFRALDTLGEITVLGIAALGVFALLRTGPGNQNP